MILLKWTLINILIITVTKTEQFHKTNVENFTNFIQNLEKIYGEKTRKKIRFQRDTDESDYNDDLDSSTECDIEGEVIEGANLKYYLVCEKENGTLQFKKYDCDKGKIYNSTESDCHTLAGNGDVVFLADHTECPDDFKGIVKYPNETMYRNYVICLPDKVIVAVCDESHFFDEDKKSCIKDDLKRNTTLGQIDCDSIPLMDCKEAGIIRIDNSFKKSNGNPNCTRCFYFCNDKERNTFELSVICRKDTDLEDNTTYSDLDLTTEAENATSLSTELSVISTSPTENFTETSAARNETSSIPSEIISLPTNVTEPPEAENVTSSPALRKSTSIPSLTESESSSIPLGNVTEPSEVENATSPSVSESVSLENVTESSKVQNVTSPAFSTAETQITSSPANTTEPSEKENVTSPLSTLPTSELSPLTNVTEEPAEAENTTSVSSLPSEPSSTPLSNVTELSKAQNVTSAVSEISTSLEDITEPPVGGNITEPPTVENVTSPEPSISETQITSIPANITEPSELESPLANVTEPIKPENATSVSLSESQITTSPENITEPSEPEKITTVPSVPVTEPSSISLSNITEVTEAENATSPIPSLTTSESSSFPSTNISEPVETQNVTSPAVPEVSEVENVTSASVGESQRTENVSEPIVRPSTVSELSSTPLTKITELPEAGNVTEPSELENITSPSTLSEIVPTSTPLSNITEPPEVENATISELSYVPLENVTEPSHLENETTSIPVSTISESSPVSLSNITEPSEIENATSLLPFSLETELSSVPLDNVTKPSEPVNITTSTPPLSESATPLWNVTESLEAENATSLPSPPESTSTTTNVTEPTQLENVTTPISTFSASELSSVPLVNVTEPSEAENVTSLPSISESQISTISENITEPSQSENVTSSIPISPLGNETESPQAENGTSPVSEGLTSTTSVNITEPLLENITSTPLSASEQSSSPLTNTVPEGNLTQPLEKTSEPTVSPLISTTESPTTPMKPEITTPKVKPSRPKPADCSYRKIKGYTCSKEGFFRLNGSCTRYYECYNSRKCGKLIQSEIYTCPSCLKFNVKTERCDLPENVPECSYLNVADHPHYFVRHIKKQKYCTGPGTFFVPDNCRKYYQCQQDRNQIHLSVENCPRRSTYSKSAKKCVKGHNCHTGPKKCQQNGYSPDRFDCSKFYNCYEGMAIPLFCPLGYIYNGRHCQSKLTSHLNNWETLKKIWHKPKK